ncbi:MAG TPA: F0F1 ATP synthase subunit B' [Stellaceae bacterium]|nr:F0F1 ATP synthase subunit B' [Stellaceae bacterium]
MPQLDFSTFPSQVFWLAVVFVVLYVLMARVGLPRVGAMIMLRKQKIEEDLGRAAQMKAEADAVMAAYERALADARTQAQATLKEAMDRFTVEANERQHKAAEKLQAETVVAERRIAEAKARALAGLRVVAVEVARAATRKIAGVEIDEGRALTAVDRVMKERAG